MRSRSDPLLGPYATKESALELIRSGLEMQNGATSAARLAKECLARGFLLSQEDRLLIGFAILLGSSREEDIESGEAVWHLAAEPLVKRGKAELVLEYALRLFNAELARGKHARAHEWLREALPAVRRLPLYHAGVLQFRRSVEEYVYVTNDVDGGEQLNLK